MEIPYTVQETSMGRGLFAAANVAIGARVWSYCLGQNVQEFDEAACLAHLQRLPDLPAQQRFLDLTFGRGHLLCLILDDGVYMNHANAEAPDCNCQTDMLTGHCFSTRAIAAGEQLFEDYRRFTHPPFLQRQLTRYACVPDYYAFPFSFI